MCGVRAMLWLYDKWYIEKFLCNILFKKNDRPNFDNVDKFIFPFIFCRFCYFFPIFFPRFVSSENGKSTDKSVFTSTKHQIRCDKMFSQHFKKIHSLYTTFYFINFLC